jgi:hypothetical protein
MLKSVDPCEKDIALQFHRSNPASPRKSRSNGSGRQSPLDPWASDNDWTEPDWLELYMEGLQRSIFGFELAPRYEGLIFGELVSTIYEEVGAIVVALYENGRVKICPQRTHKNPCHAGQICFAIATNVRMLDSCRLPGQDPDHWRESLLKKYDQELLRARKEGPHVAAAQLMGDVVKSALIGDEGEADPDDDGANANKLGRTLDSKYVSELSDDEDFGEAISQLPSRSTSVLQRRYSVDYCELSDGEEEMMQVKKLRNLRMMARFAQKELILLIVCNGDVWQQVLTFANALTPRYLPVVPEVIVVAPSQPPPRLFEGCDRHVTVLKGECTKILRLLEAGVLEAAGVVVMAGEVPAIEQIPSTLYRDSKVMLCAAQLECWCGLEGQEVFTTYELQESASVWHLPKMMKKRPVSLRRLVEMIDSGNGMLDRPLSGWDEDVTAGAHRGT